MSEIVITQQEMYRLLLSIDAKVTAMAATMETLDERVADHEARLRTIEAKEDLARRTQDMESAIRDLQRRVWALPSAATAIALGAVVLTLVRTY